MLSAETISREFNIDLLRPLGSTEFTQKDLLELICDGFSSKEIAEFFERSPAWLASQTRSWGIRKGQKTTWYEYFLNYYSLKKCSKCGEVKETTLFSRDKTKVTKLQAVCKTCQSYYRDDPINKNRVKKWAREYQAQPHIKKARKEREALRRSIKLKRLVYPEESQKIKDFYERCPEGYHVDHIIPLNSPLVSGFHCITNLQYLPAINNLKKSNKFDPNTFIGP